MLNTPTAGAEPIIVELPRTATAELVKLRPVLVPRSTAAAMLGISERGLDRLLAESGLPSVMIGGRRLFRPADLEAWAAEAAR